jgi:protein-S-isoprenylcysteine O-methyltransferase Ste14
MVLAITSGLAFFDLGRRDRLEHGGDAASNQCTAPSTRNVYGDAMQLAFLALLCAGAWDNRAPELAWRHPGLLGIGGFLLIVAGLILRRSAARALGRHFTVDIALFTDHQLVTSGPYRWLRHPNYAGLLLIALGTATMVWSPRAAGMALVVWLPIALLRIAEEERALHARLGTAWTDYARGSWCVVPGVY